MTVIIDRRKNGKDKSSENRQKFLRRYKKSVSEAVRNGVVDRSISDINSKGVEIKIKRKSISEASFSYDYNTGIRQGVNPGNVEYVAGDKIKKPPSQEGAGGGGGENGDGEDTFTFSISKDEFMDFFFSELELPNLIRQTLNGSRNFKWKRAGIANNGVPANLDLSRSMMSAVGRRFALKGSHKNAILELRLELEQLEQLRPIDRTDNYATRINEIHEEIATHERRSSNVPFLDDVDLKYKIRDKVPEPTKKAVMFCVMDVSGSMGEHEKDLAKRFYVLLYMFLTKSYDIVDVRYIRQHHEAREVDEDTFFNDTDSGGTIVTTGFELADHIIRNEYGGSEWNIYVAQTSDGDNWNSDSQPLKNILDSKILPVVSHFAYLEVGSENNFRTKDDYVSPLWETYTPLMNKWHKSMDMQKVHQLSDIGVVFKEFYKKRTETIL